MTNKIWSIHTIIYFSVVMLLFSCDYHPPGLINQRGIENDSLAIYERKGDSLFEGRFYKDAITFYRYSLQLLPQQGTEKGEGILLKKIGLAYLELDNYEKALRTLLSAEIELKQEPQVLAEVKNNIGLVEQRMGNYSRALAYFKEAETIYRSNNDSVSIAKLNINIGINFYLQGFYDESLLTLFLGLRTLEASNNPIEIARCCENIAIVYSDQGNFEKALLFFNKAADIYHKISSEDNSYVRVKLNIATLFVTNKEYEKAFEFYKKLKINTKTPSLLAAININIGKVYSDKNQCDSAINYYLESEKLASQIADHYMLIFVKRNIAVCYVKSGKIELAIETLHSGLELADSIEALNLSNDILTMLVTLYSSTKEFEKAFFYHKKYAATKDTLFNKEKFRDFKLLEARYETQKKEKEILLLENRQESDRNRQIVLGMLLFIVLLILLLIFIKFKTARKLYFLREELMQRETINIKQRLNGYTQIISQKNNLITTLKSDINNLVKSDTINTKQAKSLNQLFQIKILTASDWEHFKQQFDLLYPNYLFYLRKHFADLTFSEERLFILVKLKYTTSEIADVLGISNESVKKSRHRLRKKLVLHTNQSLEDYIEEFGLGINSSIE